MNPADYELGVRTTFLAGIPTGYLGRRVQSEGLEGSSFAGESTMRMGEKIVRNLLEGMRLQVRR